MRSHCAKETPIFFAATSSLESSASSSHSQTSEKSGRHTHTHAAVYPPDSIVMKPSSAYDFKSLVILLILGLLPFTACERKRDRIRIASRRPVTPPSFPAIATAGLMGNNAVIVNDKQRDNGSGRGVSSSDAVSPEFMLFFFVSLLCVSCVRFFCLLFHHSCPVLIICLAIVPQTRLSILGKEDPL